MAETKEEFLERIFSNQELENAIKNNNAELEVIFASVSGVCLTITKIFIL